MQYVYLTQGLTRKKQYLIPTDNNVYDYIKNEHDKDWYTSIFLYNDEHKKLFEEKRSVAGVTDIQTSRLVFDFDDEADPDKARQDAKILCDRLIEGGAKAEDLQICFSGNKGYSVELELEDKLTRDQFKNAVFNLASDLETFDDTIHDYQRIFRVPLTTHQESKLYKIPLNYTQLKEVNTKDIFILAKDRNNVDEDVMQKWHKIRMPDAIRTLSSTPYEKPVQEVERVEVDLDLSKCPRWMTPEKFAIMQGYIPPHTRDKAMMILASTLKNQGMDKNDASAILKSVAKKRIKIFPDTEFCPDHVIEREIIQPVYRDTWRGGMYGREDELLSRIREELNIPLPAGDGFVSLEQLYDHFKDFAINIEKNTIKTGLPIDDQIRIVRGMPVGLLGGPSSGKTSLLLNILRNTSMAGMHSIFFSLDMHDDLLIQKEIQLMSGDDGEKIYRIMQNDAKRAGEYRELLKKQFSNVHHYCKSGLDALGIREVVEAKKREVGPDLKLVAIDYFECIHGPYSDPTANSAIIADQIKDIAKDLDVCVLLLVQPPKVTGGAAYPLTNMYQIKGSSVVAQAMRVVIGLYRVGFNPHTFNKDKYITLVSLKNTMGELFKVDCYWNGQRGTIDGVVDDYDDQAELDMMRDELLNIRREASGSSI